MLTKFQIVCHMSSSKYNIANKASMASVVLTVSDNERGFETFDFFFVIVSYFESILFSIVLKILKYQKIIRAGKNCHN